MKDFFAALDTPGGHIVVCIALIVLGFSAHKEGFTLQGDTLITSASAAIFFAMKGNNGGRVTITPSPMPGATTQSSVSSTKTEIVEEPKP